MQEKSYKNNIRLIESSRLDDNTKKIPIEINIIASITLLELGSIQN